MFCNYFQRAALEKKEFTLLKSAAFDMSKKDDVMELVDEGYVEVVNNTDEQVDFRVTESGLTHSVTLPDCY